MALTGKIMDFFADKAMTIPAFPRTKIKAVSDDDGTGLDAILNNIDNKISEFSSGKTLTEHLAEERIVLTSLQYGDTLPDTGVLGQLYFKKVTE